MIHAPRAKMPNADGRGILGFKINLSVSFSCFVSVLLLVTKMSQASGVKIQFHGRACADKNV